MKKKTRTEQLKKIFKSYELQERKEFRQTGIAIMSGASGFAILTGLHEERATAFTADEIEGCFPFTASCYELVRQFDQLKDADVNEEDRVVMHEKIDTYILLLLSGVFAEIFYLMFDTSPDEIQVPRKANLGDYFNYVYSQKEYDPIREKVNALRRLKGESALDTGNGECDWWVLYANFYRGEMDTVWARKTQLDAIIALRELKKVPGELLWWLASQNMKMEQEYNQGIYTNIYRKYDFKSFAAEAAKQANS